jgi:hypothetical protein
MSTDKHYINYQEVERMLSLLQETLGTDPGDTVDKLTTFCMASVGFANSLGIEKEHFLGMLARFWDEYEKLC